MANKTISKLSILLSLNADDLKGQADGAKKKLKDLGNGAEKSLVGIRGLSLGMGRLPGGFSAIVSFAGPAIAAIAAFLGGVLAIRSIYSTIRGATDRLEELYNTSVKLGESSLALMSLRKAADEVGAGSATLDMSLQRMTRRISEATLGSGEAVGALKELGLVAGELTVLSPHEALERIAVAMDGVKNNADKTRIAMKLFDSEGVALLNLLPQIAEGGVAKLAEETEHLTGRITELDLKHIADVNKAWSDLGASVSALGEQLAITLAPAIQFTVELLTSLVAGINRTIVGIRDLLGFETDSAGSAADRIAEQTKELRRAAIEGQKAKEAELAMAEAAKMAAEHEKARADELERLVQAADSLREKLRTPAEQVRGEFEKLSELFTRGLISNVTLHRAIADIRERFGAGLKTELEAVVEPIKAGGQDVRTSAGQSALSKLNEDLARRREEERDRFIEARRDWEKRNSILSAIRDGVGLLRDRSRATAVSIVG